MGYQEILINEEFLSNMRQLKMLEKDRIYCRHGLEHLLDVCRIAYIRALEDGISISKNLIYGAGLLHDIGRVLEYQSQIPHHTASVRLAGEILCQCGYEEADIKRICDAIGKHREGGSEDILTKLIYEADKLSRCCFACEAYAGCKWPEEKKNKGVRA